MWQYWFGALNYGEKQAGLYTIYFVIIPGLIMVFFLLRFILRCLCACLCKAKASEVVAKKEEKSPEKK
jgi:hypothetical protein